MILACLKSCPNAAYQKVKKDLDGDLSKAALRALRNKQEQALNSKLLNNNLEPEG